MPIDMALNQNNLSAVVPTFQALPEKVLQQSHSKHEVVVIVDIHVELVTVAELGIAHLIS